MAKLNSFAVNAEAIEGGEWVEEIPDCGDLKIKTRGLGNSEWKRLNQTLVMALPRTERRNPKGLTPERQREITAKLLAHTCVLDWNLTDDDEKPIACSPASVFEIISNPKLGPLYDACLWAAAHIGDSREDDKKEDAGN